jgi:hypothetical protein
MIPEQAWKMNTAAVFDSEERTQADNSHWKSRRGLSGIRMLEWFCIIAQYLPSRTCRGFGTALHEALG